METNNKYMVKIVNLFSTVLEVEAKDEEDAKVQAHKKYTLNPEENRKAYYESTLPPQHWAVITKEKYEQIKQDVEAELKNNPEKVDNIITQ